MRRYRLHADATFWATGREDALTQLAEHFDRMTYRDADELFLPGSDVRVDLVEPEQETTCAP